MSLIRRTARFPTSRGRWPSATSIERAGAGCQATGRFIRSADLCLTPSRAPRIGGFEILQGTGYVGILYNLGHYYRFIPTDERPRGMGGNVTLWMGNSRGSWEGNTLVVDVTNLNAKNWLDQVGNFFSDNVHVVERFTLVAPNIVDYEVTIDDPKVHQTVEIRLPSSFRRGARPYAGDTWGTGHESSWRPRTSRGLGSSGSRGPPRSRVLHDVRGPPALLPSVR